MALSLPHDTADLLLSPVALAVDARLAELGRLAPAELSRRIVLETNTQPRTCEEAGRALADAAGYLIETHNWELAIDPRGLRLTHEGHSFVLGLSASLRNYVEDFAPVVTVPAAR